jgi:hypothetical protein
VAVLVNTWPYSSMDQIYVNALSVTPGETDAALTPVPEPAPPNNSSWYILNVGYTLQWWLFGVVGLWWFTTYVRRLANPAPPEDDDETEAEDDEDEEVEGLTQPQQSPAPTAPTPAQ